MPRAKKDTAQDGAVPQIYVKVPWTTSVDARYIEWREQLDGAESFKLKEGLLVGALDFKIGHANDGVFCSLIDHDLEAQGEPFILSGWGEDGEEAIMVALFKHFVLLHENWTSADATAASGSKRR